MAEKWGAPRGLRLVAGISIVLVIIAACLSWYLQKVIEREKFRTGAAIWNQATEIAAQVKELGNELPTAESLAAATARTDLLLQETMDLAQRLSEWRYEIDEKRVPVERLLAELMELAGELASYKKLIKSLDAPVSSLKRARVRALDAIRILMYNLSLREFRDSPEAQAATVRLRSSKRRAQRVAAEAEEFGNSVMTAAFDETTVTYLLIILAALALWITMVLTVQGRITRHGGPLPRRPAGGAAKAVEREEKEKETTA